MNLSKQQRFIVFAVVASIVLLVGTFNHLRDRREKYILSGDNQKANVDFLQEDNLEIVLNQPEKIIVHIEGEVYAPGIYELGESSRIFDAVEAAGGLTPNADRRRLNLARRLNDEEFIYVVSHDETEPVDANWGQEALVAGNQSQNALININYADTEDLKKLNGIGDSLAKRIIEYRELNGYYQQIEDIQNVSGIGEKKFQDIKDEITTR
ncbi:competence protein ComEA helix-hairpin-helix repeat protein [Alkaliphilus metalliredigens QYMF]|uniref:Competence protein ComEA helix-hairpin-helix repeat protein n=1 Tax=Alkaliphilus metalliredigens (strain QYMF) TaxID=293826 RepID=A6TQK9_ALKMQ|nr:ComEA family DNA-binding protein [Alkaliphilus metalliredigens]ABR48477.1 competence protein ComEA helix-hairpin-helix repeat protein [Alkaliphilus metalliredigens QYMF]